MSQLQESYSTNHMESSISSIPPGNIPTYYSDRERQHVSLLQQAMDLVEGMEVTEYTRHMIAYLQAGFSKEDAHERAVQKTYFIRDSQVPPRK